MVFGHFCTVPVVAIGKYSGYKWIVCRFNKNLI